MKRAHDFFLVTQMITLPSKHVPKVCDKQCNSWLSMWAFHYVMKILIPLLDLYESMSIKDVIIIAIKAYESKKLEFARVLLEEYESEMIKIPKNHFIIIKILLSRSVVSLFMIPL